MPRNILPSYSQPGWGGPLNAYLAKLDSSILSLEKDVNYLKGEDGTTLLKYAGSGFADTSMKLTFKTNVSESYVTSTIDVTKMVQPLEGENDENADKFQDFHKLFLKNGKIFLSASLYYSTGRLVDFSTPLEINLKTLLNGGSIAPGCYAIVIFESVDTENKKITYIPKLKQSFKENEDDTYSYDPGLWLDVNFCRIGIITVLDTNGDKKYLFTPAPSISTLSNSGKEDYIMNIIFGNLKYNNVSKLIPSVYTYRLEGGSYFTNYKNVSSNAESQLLTVPSDNMVTMITDNEAYLFDDESKTITAITTANFEISDNIVDNRIYIGYLTATGRVFFRKLTEVPLNFTDSETLGNLKFLDFNYLYPNYGGVGAKEYIRFVRRVEKQIIDGKEQEIFNTLITYTPNYALSNPYLVFDSNAVPWNTFGLCPAPLLTTPAEIGDASMITINKNVFNFIPHIIPETENVEKELSKVHINISEIPLSSDERYPGIMVYNHTPVDRLTIRGQDVSSKNIYTSPHIWDKTSEAIGEAKTVNGTLIAQSAPVIELINTTKESSKHSFLSPSAIYIGLTEDILSRTGHTFDKDYKYNPGSLVSNINNFVYTGASEKTYLKINSTVFNTKVTDTFLTLQNSVLETGTEGRLEFGVANNEKIIFTSIEGSNEISGVDKINFTSDRRYKENIVPLENGYLQKINQLPIYSYNLIKNDNKTIGIMAQDLKKIEPELVTSRDDGLYKDKLEINEIKLVFMCMKAIQELSEEVEKLKKKV